MSILNLFGAKKALVVLKRQSAEFYFSNSNKISFPFSSETVRAEEIIDREKLLAQIAEFISANNLYGLIAIIVLSDEIVYKQIVSETDRVTKFLDKLPFPREKIVSKVYSFEDKKMVTAVNGELFLAFAEVIGKTGGEVTRVVPFCLLSTPFIENINVSQIFANVSLLQTASFL